MQVSVVTCEGSERKLKIQVPAETLNQEVENRLKSMSGQVKLDGFRPGKVPLKVIKQRYGEQIFHEVAGEMVQNTFRDAITQENLSPVGEPVINAQTMEMGQPLEYTATFDVIEDISLSETARINLEKLEAEVSDADVEKMIETLRTQRALWNEEDRPAQDGDKITISFKGTIEGKTFSGGDADNTPVIIGSGSMVPGFEEQLTGLSKSETTTIKVTFPADYNVHELAGKDAEFAIEVARVESSTLPEVDEEFARAFGIQDGDVSKLNQEIKGNMERELENRLKADLKAKVMDQLIENNNTVNAPGSMVNAEASALQKQAAEVTQGSEPPLEQYLDEATKRVKLGMIMGEVIKTAGITLDQEMVKKRVEEMSVEYADAKEFIKHYMSNKELMRSVETMVMEDLVVDWVVDSATVTAVKTTFDEVMSSTK